MYLASLIISPIIIILCWLYIGATISDKKVSLKDFTVIISIILSMIMLIIITLTIDNYVKIFINFLLIGCLYKLVFKKSINKSFEMSFITILYYFISELIVAVMFFILVETLHIDFDPTASGNIYMNLIISLLVIILFRIKFSNYVCNQIMNLLEKVRSQEIVYAILLAIGIFGKKNAILLQSGVEYIVNLILLGLYGLIIFNLYKEKKNSTNLSEKYDQLFNYIQKYEKQLTDKSMVIHEFKNEIIAIKGFIPKRNKNLNAYVDSIMEDFKVQESNDLRDMDNLPKGGLKGLLYYKLGDLKEKGINVTTSIDSKIKNNLFLTKDSQTYKDILKVIGVYLDNAIEAVSNVKNKEIMLEIYCEHNVFHFILTNTYNGQIDETKISEIGYSTKGKNRGYGLYLVKKVIEKYDNIKQIREINDKFYSIHLEVKKKKDVVKH